MSAGAPILYSFRRCPYAMRARLALHAAGIAVEHREILLRDKPQAMLDASPKGTVPVLVLPDGRVLEESLDVAHWALTQNDPEDWLAPGDEMAPLIARCDGDFKHHLDRYKSASRHDTDPAEHFEAGSAFLAELDARLSGGGQLFGARMSLADAAIFPFVRQFAHTDREAFDGLGLSGVSRWLDDHLASPRFAAVMAKHPLWSPDGPTG
ncbi:MAG: glutathione S-transferase [Maricaulis sp.]|nr:glutathione S-transferase [Maricaulis sp.]